MASNISNLSNEMLDRIFSFLSEDKQVGACRMACRLFKELSSPYLITRVVFARRLRTIARLNKIVEHDYFRRHVIELICDVSYYCENRATDWGHISMKQASKQHKLWALRVTACGRLWLTAMTGRAWNVSRQMPSIQTRSFSLCFTSLHESVQSSLIV